MPAPSSPWRSPTTWMLLAAVALSLLTLRPLKLELGTALVLGYVSERPVGWLLRRIRRAESVRWHWGVATGFAFATSLLLLVPSVIAVRVALLELGHLVSTANYGVLERAPTTLMRWARTHAGFTSATFPTTEFAARGRALVLGFGNTAARTAGSVLAATPGAIFSAFVVLTGWVTFAVKGHGLRDVVLPRVIPWSKQREVLRRTTAEVIDGVVLANVGVSCVQAAIIAVSTLAMGVPHAIVWGVASFVLSFVPLLGTALVTVSATIYLFAMGRVGATVAMGIVAIVAGGIDNVLRPMLARGTTELPFLWIMVALVGGLTMFGPSGVILGPLFLSCAVALWHLREEERAATEGTPHVEP